MLNPFMIFSKQLEIVLTHFRWKIIISGVAEHKTRDYNPLNAYTNHVAHSTLTMIPPYTACLAETVKRMFSISGLLISLLVAVAPSLQITQICSDMVNLVLLLVTGQLPI